MELNEQVVALQNENKQYKDFLESVNAEKIAIDQLLVENLKSLLQVKKENVMNLQKIESLNQKVEVLNKEKEVVIKELSNLKEEIVNKEVS